LGQYRRCAAGPQYPEFSGRLAGTGSPITPDNTFGPQVVFQKSATPGSTRSQGPPHGLQFFGLGADGVMNVSLKDINDNLLWSKRLDAAKS
jgi:hypothetical protein